MLTSLVAQSVKNSPANTGDTSSISGLGSSPGEGNGNPLQYSCLGNHMDREPWRATVHGVPKSQTQLGDHAKQTLPCSWIKSKFWAGIKMFPLLLGWCWLVSWSKYKWWTLKARVASVFTMLLQQFLRSQDYLLWRIEELVKIFPKALSQSVKMCDVTYIHHRLWVQNRPESALWFWNPGAFMNTTYLDGVCVLILKLFAAIGPALPQGLLGWHGMHRHFLWSRWSSYGLYWLGHLVCLDSYLEGSRKALGEKPNT